MSSVVQPGSTRPKSALEKALGAFAEVRGGEGGTVLMMTLTIFLILTAYYIIKPVREALILAAPRGAEFKSYASAGQALLLLGAVPLYAALASRVPRRRLINTVTLFFAANLVVFYLLLKTIGVGTLALGIGFFLWVGIFNLMVPAQFWSFANDIYTKDQGTRLFAIVAFGASLGAVLGSTLTDALIEPLGLAQLLLVSGALLVASLLLTNVVEQRSAKRRQESGASEEEPLPKGGAFQLVLKNRYLLLIAMLMLLLNWVNTTGEYILGQTVENIAKDEAAQQGLAEQAQSDFVGEYVGGFYARFFSVVNIAGLVMQLFLVSRILKYLGVRVALMILPIIALGGYALLAFVPVLSVIRWAKTAENSVDYSVQNTVRQALFLPTTREQKYKAKQAIDTFFVRAGDVASAVLVYIGLNLVNLPIKGFALFNLGLVFVWLFIALAIGKRYQKLAEEGPA